MKAAQIQEAQQHLLNPTWEHYSFNVWFWHPSHRIQKGIPKTSKKSQAETFPK